jgi:hypothetical protein
MKEEGRTARPPVGSPPSQEPSAGGLTVAAGTEDNSDVGADR